MAKKVQTNTLKKILTSVILSFTSSSFVLPKKPSSAIEAGDNEEEELFLSGA